MRPDTKEETSPLSSTTSRNLVSAEASMSAKATEAPTIKLVEDPGLVALEGTAEGGVSDGMEADEDAGTTRPTPETRSADSPPIEQSGTEDIIVNHEDIIC